MYTSVKMYLSISLKCMDFISYKSHPIKLIQIVKKHVLYANFIIFILSIKIGSIIKVAQSQYRKIGYN